ncbi:MAG: GNAT family N-acetyltransferase [Ignavibacteria bacterium]|jgi:ribosomal protein S18 acetylase RimI-like enzyme
MLRVNRYDNFNELEKHYSLEEIINFLYAYLDKFGDSKSAIKKSIEYAFSEESGKGGFVLTGTWQGNLVAVVVMNKTGMSEYIPDNVLVYVAVNSEYRNKGIGASIIKEAIQNSEGNVKLHVEYDNPAKRLYERLGFENKYAEMRFTKEN